MNTRWSVHALHGMGDAGARSCLLGASACHAELKADLREAYEAGDLTLSEYLAELRGLRTHGKEPAGSQAAPAVPVTQDTHNPSDEDEESEDLVDEDGLPFQSGDALANQDRVGALGDEDGGRSMSQADGSELGSKSRSELGHECRDGGDIDGGSECSFYGGELDDGSEGFVHGSELDDGSEGVVPGSDPDSGSANFTAGGHPLPQQQHCIATRH